MLPFPVNSTLQPRQLPNFHSRRISYFAHPLASLLLGGRASSPDINSAPRPRYLGSPHPSRMPLAGACGDSLLFHGPRIMHQGPQRTIFGPVCFHALTNCKFCNSFVFTFIQNARGWTPLCSSSRVPYTLPSSVYPKSFVCHSYENCRGVSLFFPKRNALAIARREQP